MTDGRVKLTIDGEVGTLLLDRPPANLFDIVMLEQINEAFMELREQRAVKVLVVRGSATTFSDGIDLEDHTRERVQRLLQVQLRVFESMRMTHAVTVAAVEGRALGAGFELALGCNLFVATETATFGLPQIRYGLLPPVAAAILPRIAPRRRVMEWILTGNRISARRLEHDGVVNRLFPEDNFDGQLEQFLAELTSRSGPVLQLARRAQYEAYYTTFPEALSNIQTMYLKELIELEDAQEGSRAALEQRKPVWRNA